MDWTTPLRSQQADFIQRLKSDCLLHCETQGQHSELTVISDKNLSSLRGHCKDMTNKFKDRHRDVFEVYLNHLKGKLGEKVVKLRLDALITEIDYENRMGGDGKVDFRLTSDPSVGIQVKARHGSVDTVQWWISKEEVEKNAALVCILIQEKVNEAQTEYNLIMAGFLPTNRIDISNGKASVSINELLYSGGLRSYLEGSKSSETNGFQWQEIQTLKPKEERGTTFNQNKYQYIERQPVSPVFDYFSIGNSYYEKGDYQGAITNYNQALQLNPNFAEAYCWRGAAHYAIGDKISAISDFNQGLCINPSDAIAHSNRVAVHFELGDKQKAIDDFNQAIRLNPNYARAYYNRANTYADIGYKQRAIEDYTQALDINPNYAKAYYDRAVVRSGIRDKLGEINDFEKAADLFQQQGDQENYQKALDKIGRFDIVAG